MAGASRCNLSMHRSWYTYSQVRTELDIERFSSTMPGLEVKNAWCPGRIFSSALWPFSCQTITRGVTDSACGGKVGPNYRPVTACPEQDRRAWRPRLRALPRQGTREKGTGLRVRWLGRIATAPAPGCIPGPGPIFLLRNSPLGQRPSVCYNGAVRASPRWRGSERLLMRLRDQEPGSRGLESTSPSWGWGLDGR